MISVTTHRRRASSAFGGFLALMAAALCMLGEWGYAHASEDEHKTFGSPELAVQALIQAARQGDKPGMLGILGPEGKEVLDSGDDVAYRQELETFLRAYDAAHALVGNPDGSIVLHVGAHEWPFPIPLVKVGAVWHFDTRRGVDEILHRRVGRNELSTMQVCLAIVDAQRDYAVQDRDGDGVRAYAEKFRSDPGTRNGLYWETRAGAALSPLGVLFSKASAAGYADETEAGERSPYHGYYYRMLISQGPHAPGGAFDYMVRGRMRGGFAVLAFPAEYGNSGVMSFITNHEGIVYQKDLGVDTENVARTLSAFDPDASWVQVEGATVSRSLPPMK